MARFVVYEDVRETRKYYVEADDFETVVRLWNESIEAGGNGSFVNASTISYQVQRIDAAGQIVESFPAVEVD